MIPFNEISGIGKFIEAKRRGIVAWSWGDGGRKV